MKVTRRMTQSPEAQAAILAQAQAMGISVEDFDTIERGERTMAHTLCEQCASPATETSGLCWPCSERKRLQAINAELLAALRAATDKIEAWRDGALITRNWAVGTSIPDMEKLIASYNAIIDPARAAIAKATE